MTQRIDVYRRGAAMVIQADGVALTGLTITGVHLIDDADAGMPQLQLTLAADHIVVNASVDEPDEDDVPEPVEDTTAGAT